MANEPRFTSQDRKDLASYEKVVDQWLDKCVDAGKALLAIKERKLYLIGKKHSSFDAYVRARYAKTRQWAYDEINRAVVLAQTGYDLPTSVAQPLKGLDAKTRNEVVTKASQIAKSQKRETPTRKDVEAAIATVPAAAKKKSPTLQTVWRATPFSGKKGVVVFTHCTLESAQCVVDRFKPHAETRPVNGGYVVTVGIDKARELDAVLDTFKTTWEMEAHLNGVELHG